MSHDETIHNPWSWQDPYGFVQAKEIRGASRILECSGQVAFAPDGSTIAPNDMGRQITAALDNLESVLAAAAMTLANVAKITTFVTDMGAYFEHRHLMTERMQAAGAQHTHTLIGVTELAREDLVIEIDAVAYG